MERAARPAAAGGPRFRGPPQPPRSSAAPPHASAPTARDLLDRFRNAPPAPPDQRQPTLEPWWHAHSQQPASPEDIAAKLSLLHVRTRRRPASGGGSSVVSGPLSDGSSSTPPLASPQHSEGDAARLVIDSPPRGAGGATMLVPAALRRPAAEPGAPGSTHSSPASSAFLGGGGLASVASSHVGRRAADAPATPVLPPAPLLSPVLTALASEPCGPVSAACVSPEPRRQQAGCTPAAAAASGDSSSSSRAPPLRRASPSAAHGSARLPPEGLCEPPPLVAPQLQPQPATRWLGDTGADATAIPTAPAAARVDGSAPPLPPVPAHAMLAAPLDAVGSSNGGGMLERPATAPPAAPGAPPPAAMVAGGSAPPAAPASLDSTRMLLLQPRITAAGVTRDLELVMAPLRARLEGGGGGTASGGSRSSAGGGGPRVPSAAVDAASHPASPEAAHAANRVGGCTDAGDHGVCGDNSGAAAGGAAPLPLALPPTRQAAGGPLPPQPSGGTTTERSAAAEES